MKDLAGGSNVEEIPLRRDTLNDPRALAALGMVAARALRNSGICSLFINEKGEVEVILPGELECDGLSEDEAIRVLTQRGHNEEQLISYLRGRDVRAKGRV